jgi:hypothetical protein
VGVDPEHHLDGIGRIGDRGMLVMVAGLLTPGGKGGQRRVGGDGQDCDLFWLNGLVREFWAVEGVEDGLLVGGDGGGVGLGGAVDREGR